MLRCEEYSPSRRSRAADLSHLTTIGFLEEAELILGRELAPARSLRYLRIGRFGAEVPAPEKGIPAPSEALPLPAPHHPSLSLALPSVTSFLTLYSNLPGGRCLMAQRGMRAAHGFKEEDSKN